jgi:hypothetical protein
MVKLTARELRELYPQELPLDSQLVQDVMDKIDRILD